VDIASVVISVNKSVTIVLSVLVEDIEIVVDSKSTVLLLCSVIPSLVDDTISTEFDTLSLLAILAVLGEKVISGDVAIDSEEISFTVLTSNVEDISIVVGFVVDISVVVSNSVDRSLIVDILGLSVTSVLENINLVSGICLFFRLLDGVVEDIFCIGVDIALTLTETVVPCSPFTESVVTIEFSMFVVISTFIEVVLSSVSLA